MIELLTQRQLACLAKLPEDHQVLGASKGSPIVQRPDGQLLRVQPNGHLAATTLVWGVQPYVHIERG
jgi:hypothetical protein